MTMTSEAVLAGISRTLREDVLPKLEPASWIASDLRASLMLVVYLEDRVAKEQPMLLETNATMRSFLSAIAEGQSTPEPGLRDIARAAGAASSTGAQAHLTELRAENERYKTALEAIVEHGAVLRARPGGWVDGGFRSALQDCLASVQKLEGSLTLRASQYVPL